MGLIQLFSDKKAMTVKRTVLLAYCAQVIPLDLHTRRGLWLKGNGHTAVGFLPPYRAHEQLEEDGCGEDKQLSEYSFTSLKKVLLESDVRVTDNSVRREQKMKVHHEAENVVAEPSHKCDLKSLVVKPRWLLQRKFKPLLVLYRYDISAGKVVSAVRYGVAVERPCVR